MLLPREARTCPAAEKGGDMGARQAGPVGGAACFRVGTMGMEQDSIPYQYSMEDVQNAITRAALWGKKS